MFKSKYRNKILKSAEKYYQQLNNKDFSHDINHFFRVEKLAKRIGKEEKADLEILEAASLLFDIARNLEDKGKVKDHAVAGSKIARNLLVRIDFPKEKINATCHTILTHRKSKGKKPKTIEAKILQDADYLDALGAIDVARILGSTFQSKKYRRPVFVDDGVRWGKLKEKEAKSAIHYLIYKLNLSKMQPKNFHTRLGRKIAEKRFKFARQFSEKFMAEWRGEDF